VSGQVLLRQAIFVNQCIRQLAELYRRVGAVEHFKVILVGHSMGGFLARLLPVLDGFPCDSISHIITLGAPHQSNVVYFDFIMHALYARTNEVWSRCLAASCASSTAAGVDVDGITVTSIAGGGRDHLIETHLTSLHGLVG